MSGRSSLPQRVVRFYGNTDFALDAIAHRQVTLVHVSKLNDPFDPYFFFETDFEADYDRLCDYVQKRSSEDIDWFRRHVPRSQWQRSVEDIKSHMQGLKNSSFVLSCSAVTKEMNPKDNLYLWGHYGNGHRGIAIEFDTERVASLLTVHPSLKNGLTISANQAWIGIEYRQDMPPITAKMFFEFFRNDYQKLTRRTSLEDYYDMTVRVKSSVWRQEHEWRLLWRNDETKLKIHRLAIPEDGITAVYVGLVASPSVEADVVFETRRKFPAAKILKANKKIGFSQLRFEQI